MRFLCCRSKQERRASVEFGALTSTGRLSVDDLQGFISQHAELWAMLGVNLGIDDKRCQEIATDVAFEMACGDSAGEETWVRNRHGFTRVMTEEQFVKFRTTVVDDPKGQQLFFHKTVFAAFDGDKNGYLDASELEQFLGIFYEAGSIFKGDSRLPPKEELLALVRERLDVDRDGRLTFDEIHSLISGSAAQALTSSGAVTVLRSA